MKNIEIKTTQNVALEYELADLRDRIIAFALDLISLGVGIGLLALIGYSGFYLSETAGAVFSVFLSCVFIFYSLAFETLNNGQSLGKMAMKIQVIKTSGGRATFSDYAARWVFRMIDIYFSFGGVASILVASSSKAQRIGDIVANTTVVKLVPKMDVKLNDVLTIHSRESYKPVFGQAKNLLEADVLVIKTALERSKRFQNNAHKEAIQLLATKIKETLAIKEVPFDDRRFLQTILQDYVVLTR